MRNLTTIEVIGIITLFDVLWGSKGGLSLFLWMGYGFFRFIRWVFSGDN